MSASLPISVGDSLIRQKDGLFSLNDLHRASGALEHHRPSKYLANQQTQDLIIEIEKAQIRALSVTRGRYASTYACRELVIAYAAWISAAFHLKVIRVFLAQVQTAPAAAPDPAHEWPLQTITPQQWAALSERHKGFIEAMAEREMLRLTRPGRIDHTRAVCAPAAVGVRYA